LARIRGIVAMAEELLLVDGYNIIFAWPELNELPLDHARELLHDRLLDYCGFRGFALRLIFDAHSQTQYLHRDDEETIVYTAPGETADMYIERMVRKEAIRTGRKVRVATSDGLEQVMILGFAQRVSARELIEDIKRTQAQFRRQAQAPCARSRNMLEDRIKSEHLEQLERIRRGKDDKKHDA